jgi:hypothetical protein
MQVRKTFSNLLLGMRVYTKSVTIMGPKIFLSKETCSHIMTFINLLGYLLMGRHTTKLTIL